jgi:hypothetical protein
MSVVLTRTELFALKEMIELTPLFEGRTEAREAIRAVFREPRPQPLRIEESILASLARRVIPVDVPTAALRSKLDRELQRGRA